MGQAIFIASIFEVTGAVTLGVGVRFDVFSVISNSSNLMWIKLVYVRLVGQKKSSFTPLTGVQPHAGIRYNFEADIEARGWRMLGLRWRQ